MSTDISAAAAAPKEEAKTAEPSREFKKVIYEPMADAGMLEIIDEDMAAVAESRKGAGFEPIFTKMARYLAFGNVRTEPWPLEEWQWFKSIQAAVAADPEKWNYFPVVKLPRNPRKKGNLAKITATKPPEGGAGAGVVGAGMAGQSRKTRPTYKLWFYTSDSEGTQNMFVWRIGKGVLDPNFDPEAHGCGDAPLGKDAKCTLRNPFGEMGIHILSVSACDGAPVTTMAQAWEVLRALSNVLGMVRTLTGTLVSKPGDAKKNYLRVCFTQPSGRDCDFEVPFVSTTGFKLNNGLLNPVVKPVLGSRK
jgi:hypothetical protein